MTTSTQIRVAQDGSGDCRTIEEAWDLATENTTIHLGVGVYRSTAPLVVTHQVSLLGAGMDMTRLVGDSPAFVLAVSDGTLVARDLHIRA